MLNFPHQILAMKSSAFIPYEFSDPTPDDLLNRSRNFYELMDKRRTVRHFSDKDVDKEVIENIIKTASTAPSGAHKQPWTFAAVRSSILKNEIREGAEKEEYENYHGRMSEDWLEDLEVFETDWNKPFLETAPWLIVVFRKPYDLVNDEKKKNYYVAESVGIATGFLLAAIHNAGLVALTHTPSPMNFLGEILDRPENEKPFLLIPVGYPAADAMVPDIERKPFNEIAALYE